jgi:hypothetical protein
MNILPFVTILILVITLTISSFFSGYKETSLAKIGSTGLITAFRLARNDSERARIPPKEPKNETSRPPKTEKEKKPKEQSFRERITDNSKFNLTPLLKNDDLFLEEVFIRLLEELYVHTDLVKGYKYDKATLAKLLAKEIIQSAKNLPEGTPLEFENIKLSSNHLHALWYKMLKGSPSYPDKGSWPAASHFFIFSKDEPKCVLSGRKASIPVLKAFFDKEITNAILEKEKEADRSSAALTKDEIQKILSNHNFPLEKREYIRYGNGPKKPRHTERGIDSKTGISVSLSYSTLSPEN